MYPPENDSREPVYVLTLATDRYNTDLYADIYRYNPLVRECQVRTAKRYWRQNRLTPWFVVNEDENDTLS
ncbi:hypothetical protein KKI95_19455 [Xenorhabdus bovienii]|uniref:hypothetical protein n=1 Tax=Xenorhabdus bovienii TaxID=40576 RepID=UPI0023B21369|nr:hypothetical protein [Xenorhabdus bovienii]MDE9438016.1 hypothetical protein [Xenorhabdus bovienii]MDE9499871.1 hypothetical protein [Xenorhabdus bovienii]